MFAAWERAKAHGYTMDEAHEAIMAKKALSLLHPISVGRAVDEFIDLTDRRLEGDISGQTPHGRCGQGACCSSATSVTCRWKMWCPRH